MTLHQLELEKRGKMKVYSQKYCPTMVFVLPFGRVLLAAALIFAIQPAQAQNMQSQAKMSQMLNQFESGSRPTYTTGGGRGMGRASGMPGYANMMSGRRPSNMGGYAGMGGGGSSQMMQMMRQKVSRMQNGGGGGSGSLLQMMRQRQGGAPNMMPGMGGGPGAGMGRQSGLFAKMMQQDAAFNNNMKRNQMSHGNGMMGMRRPGMGMSGMGMPGLGMSGMGRPGMGMSGMGLSGMGKSGMGMPGGTSALLSRMGQQRSAPRVGSPFAAKPAAAAKTGALSDLEKQMESQYGK